jgi:Carboxypeptidase regulatory-like domain
VINMRVRRHLVLALLCAAVARIGSAQVFGSVRVIVRDPQNLAIADSEVTITAKGSTWAKTAKTNPQGEAVFVAVPFGAYIVSVKSDGFEPADRQIEVLSNTQTPVQVSLAISGVAQSVQVAAPIQTINPENSGTETLTHREDILLQTLADRSGTLGMITNNVPGTWSADTSISLEPSATTRSASALIRSVNTGTRCSA